MDKSYLELIQKISSRQKDLLKLYKSLQENVDLSITTDMISNLEDHMAVVNSLILDEVENDFSCGGRL